MLGVAQEGKQQAETPGITMISGWRINWEKATKQSWTLWIPRGMYAPTS